MAQNTETAAPTVSERQPASQAQNSLESQHAPLPASDRDLRQPRLNLRNPRFRLGLIIGVIVLVVVGIILWRYFSSYEET
ncbi:MAG: hypothetical protein QOD84_1267, partial [Acidobacteriaceae bacterium]